MKEILKNKFDYLDIIRNYLGNKYIKQYIYRSGLNNNVIIINNELVFKFPKDIANSSNIVLREFNILKNIKEKITTNIPNLDIGHYSDIYFSYYRVISGKTYYELSNNLNDDEVAKISEQLAIFTKELHSIDYTHFIKRGKNLIDGFSVLKNFDIITEYLNNNFQKIDFEKTLNFIDKYNFLEKDYILCHNDLNSKNIIINSNNTLSGIIDFGNSRIENFNVEFSIIAKENKKLLFNLIKSYQKLTNRLADINFIINYEKLRSYANIGLLLSNNKKIDIDIEEDLKKLYSLEKIINNFL